MSTKHRITVNLEDTEYEALQRIADASERSLAWLGRKAICDFLKEKEQSEAPLLAGLAGAKVAPRQHAQ